MEELVLGYEELVGFISEHCDVDRDDIERVLDLEIEFMRKLGIISDIPEESWGES